LSAVGLTCFATLRFVFEAFVGEKHLLAGRENKFRSAIRALQNLVMVFHTLLRGRVRAERTSRSPN